MCLARLCVAAATLGCRVRTMEYFSGAAQKTALESALGQTLTYETVQVTVCMCITRHDMDMLACTARL